MSAGDSHPLDLRDANQAGVYRVMCADLEPLLSLAMEEDVIVHEIDVTGVDDKGQLLQRLYGALDFPRDWGRNWDALADGLNDLSWLGDTTPRLWVWRGMDDLHVVAPDLESNLIAVLEDTSARWADDQIAVWSLICLTRIPEEVPDEEAGPGATRH